MSNINTNWINLVFVIDKSGSMWTSRQDVIGGFEKTIEEQKANKEGKVTVSLYTFNENVREEYLGIDINDIDKFTLKLTQNIYKMLYDAVEETIIRNRS